MISSKTWSVWASQIWSCCSCQITLRSLRVSDMACHMSPHRWSSCGNLIWCCDGGQKIGPRFCGNWRKTMPFRQLIGCGMCILDITMSGMYFCTVQGSASTRRVSRKMCTSLGTVTRSKWPRPPSTARCSYWLTWSFRRWLPKTGGGQACLWKGTRMSLTPTTAVWGMALVTKLIATRTKETWNSLSHAKVKLLCCLRQRHKGGTWGFVFPDSIVIVTSSDYIFSTVCSLYAKYFHIGVTDLKFDLPLMTLIYAICPLRQGVFSSQHRW